MGGGFAKVTLVPRRQLIDKKKGIRLGVGGGGEGEVGIGHGEWQEQVAWLGWTSGLTEVTLQILKSLSEPLSAPLRAAHLPFCWIFGANLPVFLLSVFRSLHTGF